MRSRQKLNRAYINGALAAGALIGLATRSWTAFVVASLIGIGLSLFFGDARVRRRRP